LDQEDVGGYETAWCQKGRSFLTIAGAGLAGMVESASVAAAPDPTPADRTNMKIVTDFCEAFLG